MHRQTQGASYEFGVKVSVATPLYRCKGGQFVAHVAAPPANPYDGHTLETVMPAIIQQTGGSLTRVIADAGYRGHKGPPIKGMRQADGYSSTRRTWIFHPATASLSQRYARVPGLPVTVQSTVENFARWAVVLPRVRDLLDSTPVTVRTPVIVASPGKMADELLASAE